MHFFLFDFQVKCLKYLGVLLMFLLYMFFISRLISFWHSFIYYNVHLYIYILKYIMYICILVHIYVTYRFNDSVLQHSYHPDHFPCFNNESEFENMLDYQIILTRQVAL